MISIKSLILLSCLLALNDKVVFGDDSEINLEDLEASSQTVDNVQGMQASDRKSSIDNEESVDNKLSFVKLFTGLYYEGPYGTINNHLVDHVPPEASYMENIEEAERLLAKERAKFLRAFNEGLVEALEQFISLKAALSDENKCTRRSYPALIKNDRATKGAAHKAPSERMPLRRIDWVVSKFFEHHAIECQFTYPTTYKTKRDAMDQEKLKRVELFTTNIIQKSRHKMLEFHKPVMIDLIPDGKKVKRIKGKETAEAVYKTIEFLAKGDPDIKYLNKVIDEKKGKRIIDVAGINKLLDTYFVEPCKHYVEQLGPDVFMPARFDAAVFEREDRYKLEDTSEFFLGLIRYRFCNTLITKDKDLLLKDIVKVANKQSS